MTRSTTVLAALGLIAALAGSKTAPAQGVAFQPVVSTFPNGVTLSATPAVSVDRRYVRLGMNPVFTGLEGFDTYSVPAAVTGGGLRSVAAGMDGPVGPGAYGYGYDDNYGYGYGPGFVPTAAPAASAFLTGAPGVATRPAPNPGDLPKPKAAARPVRGKTRTAKKARTR